MVQDSLDFVLRSTKARPDLRQIQQGFCSSCDLQLAQDVVWSRPPFGSKEGMVNQIWWWQWCLYIPCQSQHSKYEASAAVTPAIIHQQALESRLMQMGHSCVTHTHNQ